jgi:hypothetical protein
VALKESELALKLRLLRPSQQNMCGARVVLSPPTLRVPRSMSGGGGMKSPSRPTSPRGVLPSLKLCLRRLY